MRPESKTERAAVIAEARTWLQTPFRHQARIKGIRGGVDCANLLAGAHIGAGIVEAVKLEPYSLQWMLHQDEEIFVAELLKYTREIHESEVRSADIVVYKVGHTYSHGAIVYDQWPGTIIHAVNGLGTILSDTRREGFLRGVTKKAGLVPCRFFSAWGE